MDSPMMKESYQKQQLQIISNYWLLQEDSLLIILEDVSIVWPLDRYILAASELENLLESYNSKINKLVYSTKD